MSGPSEGIGADGFLRVYISEWGMAEEVSGKLLQRGPELWCELHCWALSTDRKNALRWLLRFETRIGCGECRLHWQALMQQEPPDFSSNEALFAWSVRMHNAVNRLLDKPEMAVDAARSHWTSQSGCGSAAASGRNSGRSTAGRSGCAGCGGKRRAQLKKGSGNE
jgi:hypothetical protein